MSLRRLWRPEDAGSPHAPRLHRRPQPANLLLLAPAPGGAGGSAPAGPGAAAGRRLVLADLGLSAPRQMGERAGVGMGSQTAAIQQHDRTVHLCGRSALSAHRWGAECHGTASAGLGPPARPSLAARAGPLAPGAQAFFHGTPHYASLRALRCQPQGPADDLESLGV